MNVQSSKPSGNRNGVSGFLRLFVLSLLAAAFACTSVHAQTVAYVTNGGDSTVSVIDTASNTPIAAIGLPGGAAPGFLAITPDGKNLYVPEFFSGTVDVVSTATNSVVTTIPIPLAFLDAVAITPNGATAYVLGVNGVSVIDTATNTLV